MRKFEERIRNLEQKRADKELSVVVLEVLEDGSVEMESADGEKMRMTRDEYDTWAERYQKPGTLHIMVEYD